MSGAGDTLVAAFAIGLACGADLPHAAMLANVAAGISVGKPGTATVGHAELGAALHRRELLALDEKIAETETRTGAGRRLAAGAACASASPTAASI